MRPYTKLAAKYYDFLLPGEFRNAAKEARLIAALFGKAKTVLDAGCGTGRLAIPLAAMGYNVTGLDITPAMTDVAKKKRGSDKIKFVVGDMCAFRSKKKFDAAVVGNNTMAHFLADTKALRCLKNLRQNITCGRALVFDVWDCGLWKSHFETRNTVRKGDVTVSFVEKNWVDRTASIHRWRHEARINDCGKRGKLTFGGTLRYRTEDEWLGLLRRAGFRDSTTKRARGKIYFVAKA